MIIVVVETWVVEFQNAVSGVEGNEVTFSDRTLALAWIARNVSAAGTCLLMRETRARQHWGTYGGPWQTVPQGQAAAVLPAPVVVSRTHFGGRPAAP